MYTSAIFSKLFLILTCIYNFNSESSSQTTIPGGNAAPKVIKGGSVTKKCGSEECDQILFEGRVNREGTFNHDDFLKYKEGDVVKVYAIEFSDRTDLWEAELNGTRGLIYKSHIDHDGYYQFLVETVEEKKEGRDILFILDRQKKPGFKPFLGIEPAAPALAKQYEVTRKKYGGDTGSENQAATDSHQHHDHDHEHGHGHSHGGDPSSHHGHSHGGFYENRAAKAKDAAAQPPNPSSTPPTPISSSGGLQPAEQSTPTTPPPAADQTTPPPTPTLAPAEALGPAPIPKAEADLLAPGATLVPAPAAVAQDPTPTTPPPASKVDASSTPPPKDKKPIDAVPPTPAAADQSISTPPPAAMVKESPSPPINESASPIDAEIKVDSIGDIPPASPTLGKDTASPTGATEIKGKVVDAINPTTPPPVVDQSITTPSIGKESSSPPPEIGKETTPPPVVNEVPLPSATLTKESVLPESANDTSPTEIKDQASAIPSTPPPSTADQSIQSSSAPPPIDQPIPTIPPPPYASDKESLSPPSPTAEIKDELGDEYCIKGDCDLSLDKKKAAMETNTEAVLDGKPNADEERHNIYHQEHAHSNEGHDQDHSHDDHHGHSHDDPGHGHSHGGHGHSHAPPPPTFFDRLKGIGRAFLSTALWTKENARPVVYGVKFILGRWKRILPKELNESISERDLAMVGLVMAMFALYVFGRFFGERSRRDTILKLSEHAELYEKYMVLKVENEKLRAALGGGGGTTTTTPGGGGGVSTQAAQQLQERYEKVLREERQRFDEEIARSRSDNEHFRQSHDLLDGELAELRRQLATKGHADKELKQHQRDYDDLKGKYESLNEQLNEYRANFEREREKVDDFERRLAEEQVKSVSNVKYGEQLREEMTAVQTLLNESRDETRRLNDELAVRSEEVDTLKQLVSQNMARMEEDEQRRSSTNKDEGGGKKSSESNGDWDLGDGLDEDDAGQRRVQHRQHHHHQNSPALDLETKLAELTDAAKLRTKIKELEEEREQMKKVLGEEYEGKRKLEQQLTEMKTDYDSMKQRQKDADQQVLQAQTRLQVLEEFFQAKQTELQKQLGQQQVLSQQRTELLGTSEERVKRYQDEKVQAEKIAEDLRRELKDVERENSKLRQDSDRQRHEAWLGTRRNERELEALRLEAVALRARIADGGGSTGGGGGKSPFVSEQRSPAGSTTGAAGGGGGMPADDNNSSEAELAGIAARESPYLPGGGGGGGKMNKSASFPHQPPGSEPPYLPFMPSYPPPPMPPMHHHMGMDYPPPPRSSGHVSPMYPYGMPPPPHMDYDDYRRGGPSPPMGEYHGRRSTGPRSTGSGGGAGGGERSGAAKRNKSKTRSPPRSPSPPPDDFRRSSGRRSEGAGGGGGGGGASGSSGARRSKSKNRSPPRIPSPSFFSRKY